MSSKISNGNMVAHERARIHQRRVRCMTNYREILRLSSLWYNNTEIADAYEKGSPLIIKTP